MTPPRRRYISIYLQGDLQTRCDEFFFNEFFSNESYAISVLVLLAEGAKFCHHFASRVNWKSDKIKIRFALTCKTFHVRESLGESNRRFLTPIVSHPPRLSRSSAEVYGDYDAA